MEDWCRFHGVFRLVLKAFPVSILGGSSRLTGAGSMEFAWRSLYEQKKHAANMKPAWKLEEKYI